MILCSVSFFLAADSLALTPDAEGAQAFNGALSDLKAQLKGKFDAALHLSSQGAQEGEYKGL